MTLTLFRDLHKMNKQNNVALRTYRFWMCMNPNFHFFLYHQEVYIQMYNMPI